MPKMLDTEKVPVTRVVDRFFIYWGLSFSGGTTFCLCASSLPGKLNKKTVLLELIHFTICETQEEI